MTQKKSQTLTIRLLGRPAIDIDGQRVPSPRGRKAWALLGYLILADRPPPSRRQLARLLFDNAVDPLGALRWSLAELRRTLGPRVAISGDPVTVRVADGVIIDVHQLSD